tara:strand:- start:4268 stop:4486 length:219 start_codon:yes stop_codon:yes gene_type:complete
MSNSFSPLADPLILETDVAPIVKSIWDRIPNINWTSALINWILPISLFLFIAFTLKARYDKKQKLYDDYLVI